MVLCNASNSVAHKEEENMKVYWTGILGLIVIMSGCAYAPQAVKITPEPQVAPTTAGQGKSIVVAVIDERPRKTLGTRGVKGVGAEITIDGDLPLIIQESLIGGLRQQGFTPTATNINETRQLRAEIRNLDYELLMGFWSGTLRTAFGLKAYCILGANRPYERLYLGEFRESVLVVQGEEANERYINAAVSSALNELFQDELLTKCLVQDATP
jgi:uncharacterized lipoprotein